MSIVESGTRCPIVPPWMHGVAGMAGISVSLALFYPLDVLRTRKHTFQGDNQIVSLRKTFHDGGLSRLYRGLPVAIAAQGICWALYLTLFRAMQQKLSKYLNGNSSKVDFLSCCVALGITTSVVTPLYLLKTRAQLNSGTPSQNIRASIHNIVRREGIRGLFKGYVPQLVLGSSSTVQVMLYESGKRYMWGDCQSDYPALGVACMAVASKTLSSVVFSPLEVMRTRMQDSKNRSSGDYRSVSAAVRAIWIREGGQGFYRGLGVNLCRVVPMTMTSFVIYEKLVQIYPVARISPASKISNIYRQENQQTQYQR